VIENIENNGYNKGIIYRNKAVLPLEKRKKDERHPNPALFQN
jgi:hypothetical protein